MIAFGWINDLRGGPQGVKRGDLEITMTLDGKKIAEKKLSLQAGEDLRDALNFVVPKDLEKRENHEIVTTIRVKGQDLVDTVKSTVRVNEQKIKILYIEHSPRWEFKFLQPALLRDRRVEVDFILVNAAPEVAKGGKPFLPEFPKTKEKFFESMYNLVILGDVDANYFSKEQLEWIREFVQKRGGLIVMAGRQNMPNTYEGTPLAEVLRIQANMLRMRRSIMAEENAARAAVMMMLPLMLIFCAIIIILLGPFVVQSMNKGI